MSAPADPAALVSEARALLSAATPGPWYSAQEHGAHVVYSAACTVGEEPEPAVYLEVCGAAPGAHRRATAALIARAPALLSALADALERAERESARFASMTDHGLRAVAGARDAAIARAERAERVVAAARDLLAHLDADLSRSPEGERLRALQAALDAGETRTDAEEG